MEPITLAVTVVFVLLALLVLIGVSIFCCHRRGLCCFRGRGTTQQPTLSSEGAVSSSAVVHIPGADGAKGGNQYTHTAVGGLPRPGHYSKFGKSNASDGSASGNGESLRVALAAIAPATARNLQRAVGHTSIYSNVHQGVDAATLRSMVEHNLFLTHVPPATQAELDAKSNTHRLRVAARRLHLQQYQQQRKTGHDQEQKGAFNGDVVSGIDGAATIVAPPHWSHVLQFEPWRCRIYAEVLYQSYAEERQAPLLLGRSLSGGFVALNGEAPLLSDQQQQPAQSAHTTYRRGSVSIQVTATSTGAPVAAPTSADKMTATVPTTVSPPNPLEVDAGVASDDKTTGAARGANGTSEHPGLLTMDRAGRYTVRAYALVYTGPRVTDPVDASRYILPPVPADAHALSQAEARSGATLTWQEAQRSAAVTTLEYFVGPDPNAADRHGWRRGIADTDVRINLDEDDGGSGSSTARSDESAGDAEEKILRRIHLHLRPPPGEYEAPLVVEASQQLLRFFRVAMSGVHPQSSPDSPFMLLNVTGCHTVTLYSRTRSYTTPAVYTLLPPPPVITPGAGDILSTTLVSIAAPQAVPDNTLRHFYDVADAEPTTSSGGVDQSGIGRSALYVVGAPASAAAAVLPTTPFTAPFKLPYDASRGGGRRLVVRAYTLGRDGTRSRVAVAELTVHDGRALVFDPSLPAPVCVVDALEPRLLLKHEGPPRDAKGRSGAARRGAYYGQPSRVRMLYQVDDAAPVTLGGAEVMPISSALGDARAVGAWDEYVAARPPAITQRRPIIRVVAEEVRHDPAAPLPPGRVAPYVASTKIAGAPSADDGAVLARSATVAYTWGAGGVAPIEDAGDYVGTATALPALGALDAPEVEVECSGVAVAFEAPTRAGVEIRYTLDGTEPHEGSRVYDAGSRVDLSRELRAQHGMVQIVARFFAPSRFEGDPARFGEKFVHHFSVMDRK